MKLVVCRDSELLWLLEPKWGRMASCGRLLIGLLTMQQRLQEAIANRPQDTIPPYWGSRRLRAAPRCILLRAGDAREIRDKSKRSVAR
jgi:hypothetical protein